MFAPIQTDRLVLRSPRPEDADGLVARRSDPNVARYQNWTLPYPEERARKMIAEFAAMNGPKDEKWWMAMVSDFSSDEVLGDVAIRLTSEGRTAEIGYTFDNANWGHGYATESVEATLQYLFEEQGVTRVFGTLHPDNRASAMVLERTGFLFEGHTKSSTWVGDEVSDDWIYGITRPDWENWTGRPRDAPGDVQLVEVTAGNERTVSKMRTHKTQEDFVSLMARSFTDALFPEEWEGAPVVPWMRAIVANDEYVGFVMLAVTTEDHPEPYLWRLLIDRLHQRRGIGGRVLELIYDECRRMGDETLTTSFAEGRGSPKQFYLSQGFTPTGRIIDDETEARRLVT